jgi:hypothetical protein
MKRRPPARLITLSLSVFSTNLPRIVAIKTDNENA